MKMKLYKIAGKLNNHPEHLHADKVTFMGFMDVNECINHVLDMIFALPKEQQSKYIIEIKEIVGL